MIGVAATADALKALIEAGDPNIKQGVAWTPHRPLAAGQVGGRHPLRPRLRVRAQGRPARRHRRAGGRRQRHRARPGAARRHRLGQDLHHGAGDRPHQPAGADPRAQQDAGRAALRRVQELLPQQRGGIFRLVLRLLPARGLRPAHRHLCREGKLDQRADRPDAPRRHPRADRARRRHHRRVGLLHLRHRLRRDLYGDDLHRETRRDDRPAPAHRRPRRPAVQALRRRFFPRRVPRARRQRGAVPGPLRGPRLAPRLLRRRGRVHRRVRPAHRPQDAGPLLREESTPTRIT